MVCWLEEETPTHTCLHDLARFHSYVTYVNCYQFEMDFQLHTQDLSWKLNISKLTESLPRLLMPQNSLSTAGRVLFLIMMTFKTKKRASSSSPSAKKHRNRRQKHPPPTWANWRNKLTTQTDIQNHRNWDEKVGLDPKKHTQTPTRWAPTSYK